MDFAKTSVFMRNFRYIQVILFLYIWIVGTCYIDYLKNCPYKTEDIDLQTVVYVCVLKLSLLI